MSIIQSFDIELGYREEKRKVWVYLPDDYSQGSSFPVIYMQDGQNLFYDSLTEYGTSWHIGETMDKLYTSEHFSAIVVGIESNDKRMDDYLPWSTPHKLLLKKDGHTCLGGKGDLYVDFLVNTLKPYVDSHYKTNPKRKATAICGSRLGGVITLYAALKHSSEFGTIGAFSTAGWLAGDKFLAYIRNHKSKYLQSYYVYCGCKESPNKKEQQAYLDSTFDICDILYENGMKVRQIVDSHGEHFEVEWAREFAEFVKFFKANSQRKIK